MKAIDIVSHQALVDSLVQDRMKSDFITFSDSALGSKWIHNSQVPVVDVMTMRFSFNKPDITIYDIKAQHSDFLQDVNKAKFEKYLPNCSRFYFACPSGLIKKEEVPDGAGLIVYSAGKDSWHVVKAARRHDCTLIANEVWMKLLMTKWATYKRVRRLKDRIIWDENKQIEDRVKNIGWEVKRKLERLKVPDTRVNEIKKAVAEGFGIDPKEFLQRDEWKLTEYIRQLTTGYCLEKKQLLALDLLPFFAAVVARNHYYETTLISLLQRFVEELKRTPDSVSLSEDLKKFYPSKDKKGGITNV